MVVVFTNAIDSTFKKHLNLQAEFNLISTRNADCMLLQTCGIYCELGHKASWLATLAHQSRRQSTS